MQLLNITFEGMLKPKQKGKYTLIEIKLPEKITPHSNDKKYIKSYQEKFLKAQEESLQKAIEERNRIKGRN